MLPTPEAEYAKPLNTTSRGYCALIVSQFGRRCKKGDTMARIPKYYVRPDGLHESIIRINGKRKAFRGKTDTEVYNMSVNVDQSDFQADHRLSALPQSPASRTRRSEAKSHFPTSCTRWNRHVACCTRSASALWCSPSAAYR